MYSYQIILAKQISWAWNRGLYLVGSKGDRGYPAYTPHLDDNLFQPLLPDVRRAFEAGDGDELGSGQAPGKMQAVHSSSALAVNIFQYWKVIGAASEIAALCGLCRPATKVSQDIRFEEKFPVDDSFIKHPNLDVVIHNAPGTKIQVFAIESKFSEAYGGYAHGGLKPKYLECADLWIDLPALRAFAESISPDDSSFTHLHPAQLVKHILGLRRRYGRQGFRLLYLWYDALGAPGKAHRDEVDSFARVAKADGILFHSLTTQELIARIAQRCRAEHAEYVRYLTERYL